LAPPTVAPQKELTKEQTGLVLLIGAVQFVNILDFVMVMPLGPMFAQSLDFSEAHIGYIGGSYTLAASISGLLGATFLDRFDRRTALGVSIFGLVLGTALGGAAVGFGSLLAARVVAGAFGGPATSVALSIVSDVIPPEVRGRALGIVMGAFSIAQVLGVPMGLWVAEHYGWRAPFFAVAGVGMLLALWAVVKLPALRAHLSDGKNPRPAVTTGELLSRSSVLQSFALTAAVMMAGFIVIPNISGFMQLNMGVPMADLKFLYFAGGIASLISLQITGRLVDRFGSFNVGTVGSIAVGLVVWTFFWPTHFWMPPLLGVISMMTFMGVRNVSYTTLTTKVPGPAERARFQSLQSAVQHGASALGAFISSNLLSKVMLPASEHLPERPGLAGMEWVVISSLALTAVIPFLMRRVETYVKSRDATLALAPTGR
jgi:predicted MFS family arabinose efflux permease